MKKYLLLLLVCVVGLTAFTPGILKDSPEKVVKKALTAYQKGDYVAYSRYLDPYSPLGEKYQELIESDDPEVQESLKKKEGADDSYEFKVLGSKMVNRDSAVVFVRHHHYDTYEEREEEIGLRKIKGNWKISMSVK